MRRSHVCYIAVMAVALLTAGCTTHPGSGPDASPTPAGRRSLDGQPLAPWHDPLFAIAGGPGAAATQSFA